MFSRKREAATAADNDDSRFARSLSLSLRFHLSMRTLQSKRDTVIDAQSASVEPELALQSGRVDAKIGVCFRRRRRQRRQSMASASVVLLLLHTLPLTLSRALRAARAIEKSAISPSSISYLGKAHQKLRIIRNNVGRILLLALLAGGRRRRGGRRCRPRRVQARARALGEGRERVASWLGPSQGGHGPQGQWPEGDGVGGHRDFHKSRERNRPTKSDRLKLTTSEQNTRVEPLGRSLCSLSSLAQLARSARSLSSLARSLVCSHSQRAAAEQAPDTLNNSNNKMRQAAPKATPPASRRERGGEKGIGSAANAETPNCVLGALPSPFGSAAPSTATETPGSSSDATCRVTTRRQSRLSAAAAANAAAVDAASSLAAAPAPAAAASSLKPQPATAPLLTDSLFAPLAAGLELRTRSSLSFEDKVQKMKRGRRRERRW